ncbi:MAG: capsule assembly Wzi family protein [Spirochaetaceae bacterium]|jgi:hypothetical protein|nr:capsule assembly Wzi family protein [Spirochaetaceae bacterium]
MRTLTLILLGIFSSFALDALPVQMFPPGHPVIRDLRFIQREQGISFVSLTPPFSSYEVRLILERVREQSLSGPGRAAYSRILRALDPKPRFSAGFFSADAHGQIGLQGRFRSNTDVAWTRGSGGTNSSWKESFIPALLKLEVNFYFADVIALNAEPGVTADPAFSGAEDASFAHNIPLGIDYVDANSPFRAFGALGGPWWNVQIGRDRASFGPGVTGNLTLSDNPDFYDFLRISLFPENFKYSFFIAQFPLSDGEHQGHSLFSQDVPDHTLHESVNRYMFLHRTDFRLFGRVSLNLTEAVMIGEDGLSLRYLNPFMIYHSFYSWNDYPRWRTDDSPGKSTLTGSMLAAEIEWAVGPSISVHGQWMMNEAAFPNELAEPGGPSPNAMGWLAGIEYARALKDWGLIAYFEGVYTDPYLYILSSPFASFISMRRLSQSVKPEYGPADAYANEQLRYQWIGYGEGRDAMVFAAGASLFQRNLGFSGEISFARLGEHTILWDWRQDQRAFEEKTPTGTPINRLIIAFEGYWQIFDFLKLTGYTAQTLLWNGDHVPGRFLTGFEMSLSAVFRY